MIKKIIKKKKENVGSVPSDGSHRVLCPETLVTKIRVVIAQALLKCIAGRG